MNPRASASASMPLMRTRTLPIRAVAVTVVPVDPAGVERERQLSVVAPALKAGAGFHGRDVAAADVRERDREAPHPLAHEDVEVVQGNRLHLDEHFSVARFRPG